MQPLLAVLTTPLSVWTFAPGNDLIRNDFFHQQSSFDLSSFAHCERASVSGGRQQIAVPLALSLDLDRAP